MIPQSFEVVRMLAESARIGGGGGDVDACSDVDVLKFILNLL
jgi:hypothetical protein